MFGKSNKNQKPVSQLLLEIYLDGLYSGLLSAFANDDCFEGDEKLINDMANAILFRLSHDDVSMAAAIKSIEERVSGEGLDRTHYTQLAPFHPEAN